MLAKRNNRDHPPANKMVPVLTAEDHLDGRMVARAAVEAPIATTFAQVTQMLVYLEFGPP